MACWARHGVVWECAVVSTWLVARAVKATVIGGHQVHFSAHRQFETALKLNEGGLPDLQAAEFPRAHRRE